MGGGKRSIKMRDVISWLFRLEKKRSAHLFLYKERTTTEIVLFSIKSS